MSPADIHIRLWFHMKVMFSLQVLIMVDSWDLATLTPNMSLLKYKESRTYYTYQLVPNQGELTAMVNFMSGVKVSLERFYHPSKFHIDKTYPNLTKFQLEKDLELLRTKKGKYMLGA